MNNGARNLPELLRSSMRRWVTGVTIVSAQSGAVLHGMTVNSFVSISLDPPLVTVTLANDTRTHSLVDQSGWFGVTVLSRAQHDLSDRFAGRIPDGGERFKGVEIVNPGGHAPLIAGGLAGMECRVAHRYALARSTLFIGQVEEIWLGAEEAPLVYWNRGYHSMGE